MKLLGLIGYPLIQSFSPSYFKLKFETEKISNYEYQLFEIENIQQLPTLLQTNKNLIGFNVTIPYKQAVLQYVHTQHPVVQQCGATNCITIHNGVLTAYNTDVVGFQLSLQPLLQEQHSKALVLGTGGAAKAVAYVLEQLHIPYMYVSRYKQQPNTITYNEVTAAVIQQYHLIINASPSGMVPNTTTFPPLPYEALTTQHLLYDLVYKPNETIFLQKGKQQGAVVKNGLEMLHLQADEAWRIWQQST